MKGNFGPQWEPIDLKGWAQQAVELDDVPGLLDAAVAAVAAVRAVRDLRAVRAAPTGAAAAAVVRAIYDLQTILDELGVPQTYTMELAAGAATGLHGNREARDAEHA